MVELAKRAWVPHASEALVQTIAGTVSGGQAGAIAASIEAAVAQTRALHDLRSFNLNPAANVMNPRAEALLASGIGSRPSLGYPGDKYETGLQGIERIEVIAAELAAEVFKARFAEVRVPSGAMANLFTFMAICEPGDAIIVPPASIGGHVTHHGAGAAGLYGLQIHEAPVDAERYTVDVDRLAALARAVKPRLITLGGSLNLHPHPVAKVAEIARAVGAKLMFDAAHLCGIIAGGAWENPLGLGADVMTMSTYKSLGGPAGGLIVSNDARIAKRLDEIAFPGLTANFDAGRTAALAMTLIDWRECGAAYAAEMVTVAQALAERLAARGVAVHAAGGAATLSHGFALEAPGGGTAMARHLERAGLLASAIGLPGGEGLRLGTPEIVRRGVDAAAADQLAEFIARTLGTDQPEALAGEVAAFRAGFTAVRHCAV